ncbi:MAG: hypothetical protein WA220_09030 [Candidatus Nitrosopolaris sp.]
MTEILSCPVIFSFFRLSQENIEMLADRRLTGATVAVRKNSVLHDGCFVDNSGRIIDIDFATANHSSQDIATDIITQGPTADCESCLGSYREDILGHCFIYRCGCQQRGGY